MDRKTKSPSQDRSAKTSKHPSESFPFLDVDYGPEKIGIEIVLERPVALETPVTLETPVALETSEWFDLTMVMRLLG